MPSEIERNPERPDILIYCLGFASGLPKQMEIGLDAWTSPVLASRREADPSFSVAQVKFDGFPKMQFGTGKLTSARMLLCKAENAVRIVAEQFGCRWRLAGRCHGAARRGKIRIAAGIVQKLRDRSGFRL